MARAGLAVGECFAFWRENSKTLNCSRGQGRAGLGEYFAFWRENSKTLNYSHGQGRAGRGQEFRVLAGKLKKTLNYSRGQGRAGRGREFRVLAGKSKNASRMEQPDSKNGNYNVDRLHTYITTLATMFFPPNYPLYKATMDAYRRKDKVDFQSVEFRDAITDAVQNAMVANNQGDLNQARQERDRCLGAEGEMRGQVDTARGELGVSLVAEGRVQGQLERTLQDRDEARDARDVLQDDLVRSRAAEGRVQGQLDETRQVRAGLERDLTTARDVLLESRGAEGQLRGQRDEAREARDRFQRDLRKCHDQLKKANAAFKAEKDEFARLQHIWTRIQQLLVVFRGDQTSMGPDGAVNFGNTQGQIEEVRQLLGGLENEGGGDARVVNDIIDLVEDMINTIQSNIGLRLAKDKCDEKLAKCESKVGQLTESLAQAAENRNACEEELLKKTRELEDFQRRNPEPGGTGDSGDDTVGAEDSEVPGGLPGESKYGDDGAFETPARAHNATAGRDPQPLVQDNRSLQAGTPTRNLYDMGEELNSTLAFSILRNAWDTEKFPQQELLDNFGLPFIEHHPNFEDDLEALLKEEPDRKYNFLQVFLYEALGKHKARIRNTFRPIYTGSGQTFDLSLTTTFITFFRLYEYLERESIDTDHLRNNYVLFVRVFLLVVKLFGVKSDGVVIVAPKPEKRDWHDEKSAKEFRGLRRTMDASERDPLHPGQEEEKTGNVAKRLDFSSIPGSRAQVGTGIGGIYDNEENVIFIDRRARESENIFPLEKYADKLLSHVPGVLSSLTDKPSRILRLLVGPSSSQFLANLGTYEVVPEDAFHDWSIYRPIRHESGDSSNLSETEAFKTFVKLRKFIINRGGEGSEKYTQDHFATVRLFLLVVRQIGLYAKKENGELHTLVRPETRSVRVPLKFSPSAASLLSNMFPWL